MKKTVLMQSLLTAVAIGGAGVASAQVSLYDYDEATSAYQDAYITGEFNAGKSRGDAQSAYNATLSYDYDQVFSSANRDFTLKSDAKGIVSRDSTEGAKSNDTYNAGISGSIDNYFTPGSNGGFWYGAGSVRANDTYKDLETKASVGVGYGRVVNVTPMAKAIRVMDELQKIGAISGTPSLSAYKSVAQVISKESEYRSRFDSKTYEQNWISDIEAAIVSGGAGKLGAAGALAIRRVLVDENISTRKHGYKVRAGVNYTGRNFEGLKNKPGFEASAEYHRPINNQTQFSEELKLNTVLNDGDDSYNVNNRMSLTHELDDRIDWENSLTSDYNKPSVGDAITTHTFGSTLSYELSNDLDLTLSGQVSNVKGSSNDGTDKSVNMGVTYRLK